MSFRKFLIIFRNQDTDLVGVPISAQGMGEERRTTLFTGKQPKRNQMTILEVIGDITMSYCVVDATLEDKLVDAYEFVRFLRGDEAFHKEFFNELDNGPKLKDRSSSSVNVIH